MDPTTKPKQKPDYYLEEIEGELLLYHPGQTTLIYCNTIASLIWQLCDGQRTIAEITALLKAAYSDGDQSQTIEAEVIATLRQFQQHGAIECCTGESEVAVTAVST